MSQSLAKDFNFRSLLKFAFPSIIMMIFMSLYSIVDGFFIAQYVDSMALSAANIVYPAVSILLAVGRLNDRYRIGLNVHKRKGERARLKVGLVPLVPLKQIAEVCILAVECDRRIGPGHFVAVFVYNFGKIITCEIRVRV